MLQITFTVFADMSKSLTWELRCFGSRTVELSTQLDGDGNPFRIEELDEPFNLRFSNHTFRDTHAAFIDVLETEPLDPTLPPDDFDHLSGTVSGIYSPIRERDKAKRV